jgi:hypothetical protein
MARLQKKKLPFEVLQGQSLLPKPGAPSSFFHPRVLDLPDQWARRAGNKAATFSRLTFQVPHLCSSLDALLPVYKNINKRFITKSVIQKHSRLVEANLRICVFILPGTNKGEGNEALLSP